MTEWSAGRIFGCVLGDDLRARAAEGDEAATRLLIGLVPRDIPPAARRAYRDATLRRLADWLHGALPGATPHRIAVMLSEAGRILGQGGAEGRAQRSLGSATIFAGLRQEEREKLTDEVRRLIRLTGGRWPRLRRMLIVIGRDGLHFPPVENADANDRPSESSVRK